MLRDITIGQYYQTDSVIHRLDPRVKLMGTLIFYYHAFFGKKRVAVSGCYRISGGSH